MDDLKATRSSALLSAEGAVLVATFGFALKGLLARQAYMEGWGVGALLLARFTVATPIVWLYLRGKLEAAKRSGNSPAPLTLKERGYGIAAGLMFAVCCWADFKSIELIGAGISRVILFTYPIYIMVFEAISQRHKTSIRSQPWGMFAIAWLGLVLVLGGGPGPEATDYYGGALWGILASMVYAVYMRLSQSLTRRLGPLRFTLHSNLGSTIAFVAFVPWIVPAQDLNASVAGIPWIALLIVFSTVIPFILFFQGLKKLGALKSSILTLTGPPVTVIGGVLLLNEEIGPLAWTGILISFGSVALYQLRRSKPQALPRDKLVDAK